MTNLELLTSAEMAEADRLTLQAGTASLALMEKAGAAVADVIISRFTPRPTIVLCGPGNNGGDGFVIARLLAAGRWPVRVALLGDIKALQGAAAQAAALWPGSVEPLSEAVLEGKGLVVDALFGAGLDRPLTGVAAQIIETIKQRLIEVVAVDIPSGVDGNSGAILGAAMKAAVTVTFFRKKPGHVLLPGRAQCGDLVVADIGIADNVLPQIKPRLWQNAPELWLKRFPRLEEDTNKYRRGHVLVVGGEMTGAGRLAAHAAQRIGAGLVTIACPASVIPIYSAASASLIVKPHEDLKTILEERHVSAIVIGPGLGTSEEVADQLYRVLEKRLPTVLDADALTLIGQHGDLRDAVHEHCVLTPHQGEFKRVFSFDADRLSKTQQAAAAIKAVVLLKGSDTIIAAPDGKAIINSAASPWLATGGSGDTLSGLVGGLLAQRVPPFFAAAMASWIHSECGRVFGPGLIADDLANLVPQVLRELLAA